MSVARVKSINHICEHDSVMVEEVLIGLNLSVDERVKNDGIYVDLTFGRGGHSRAILDFASSNARVFALDKDPAAKKTAEVLEQQDPRFKFKAETFSKVDEFCQSFGILGKVNGVLMDVGVSSPQLDEGDRGFSFKTKGPLDMRMDPTKGLSAADWINTVEVSEIERVLKEYGEERFYKRIAQAIVLAREQTPITTTEQFAEIVSKANPAWEKHKHPATRTFQAIRIFINNELQELSLCLDKIISVLAPKGRLVVISFHSLEDRIVKQFIQRETSDKHPKGLPILAKDMKPLLRKIGRKQKPSPEEILRNRRARSAVLRVAEKMEEGE